MQQTVFARNLRCAAGASLALLICAALSQAQVPVTTPLATSPAATSREIVDEFGRKIHVPATIRRVVSLAPSLTETIFALGLQDLLVGDTTYCDFPAEAQKKAKVGDAINPSLEAIVALHPDLVLVTNLNRLETVSALAELGIPSYGTNPHNVYDIISSTQRVADLLGAREAGTSLSENLQRSLADTRQRVAPFPQRRVLFVVWAQPLISVGKDTFIADALQHAGAVSIVDSAQSWPQLNLEEVVRQQPDFLVFAESHGENAIMNAGTFSSLPGWRILEAVRNRRYAVTSDAVNRPAPRIVSAIADLARQLHPEAFAEKSENEKNKAENRILSPFGVSPRLLSLAIFVGQTLPNSRDNACAR